MDGKQISKLRKERGLTQQKFAEAIHVTQSAVSQWENGLSNPSTQQLFILANFFKVPIDTLYGSPTEAKPADETEKQEQFQPAPSLADRQRRDVEAMLRAMSDADLEKVYDYVRFVAQNKK